jgi:uncharacterized protein DUF4386
MARRAGALYFLFMIVSIYGEFFFPKFMVPGDPTATASKITAAELTYRIGILIGLTTHIIFIFLVLSLYRLLRDVDKSHAMLMVVLVSVGVAVAISNMLNRFAPLVLLDGADYMSAFTKTQLDALAVSSLRFRSSGAAVPMAFWGLWLFPFGMLVVRSRFLPRILGMLLIVAGFAYLVTSAVTIALPGYRRVVSQYMMPLYFGEVPIIFWLLIKGARVPQPEMRSARLPVSADDPDGGA